MIRLQSRVLDTKIFNFSLGWKTHLKRKEINTNILESNHMKNIVSVVLKAVGLAMGVVVIVLSILGTLTSETGFILLGIGMAALGLATLQKE